MEREIILAFDIPREKAYTRVKVWRKLHEIGARQRLRSHWILPFSKKNLLEFKRIAKEIKEQGGKVELIIGKVIE